MARPLKEGMDYFPHDTDALSDDKIEILRALYGNDGYVFYFGLLERIYREPTFEYDISDAETIQILCKKLLINEETFQKILTTALKYNCFDKEIFEKTGCLTSSGIKKRAEKVVEKRVKMRVSYASNISDAETIQKTSRNAEETPQSKVKKSKVNNSPISPKGIDERFDSFWQAYPKKVGKGAAEKAFKKYKPDDALLATMLKAIEVQKKSAQWCKDGGQYIPNPATYLNQRRWEDETDTIVEDTNDSWGGIPTL